MKTRRLATILITLAVLLVTAVAGFAGGKTESDGKLDIVFVTPLIAHPVWDVARAGFEDAAKEMNFRGQYVGPQGIDPTEMVNQIEIAIAQKVDGIISMPIAPTAMRPVFKKAAEAKIPVVFIGSVDPEAPSLASVGTNEDNIGRIGAEAIKAHFGAMGNPPLRAIVMQSTMDASFAMKARDGYLNHLKDYPDFKMVINEACNSDMVIAMQKYEAVFKAYPEINLVIGVCGEAGPAAAKVLKEQNLLGKITVVGIDDVAETLDLVRDGSIWGTVAQNFYKMAYLSSEILIDYIRDGKKPAASNKAGYDFDSGAMFVTQENIDTYKSVLMAK
jgi:ribose transport system substrate-binding protein